MLLNSLPNKYMMHIKYLHYLLEKYNIQSILDLNNTKNFNNYQEFLLNTIDLMINYINENLLQLMYTDLYDIVFEHIYNILYTQYIEENILPKLFIIADNNKINLLYFTIKISQNLLFKFYIPKRSYKRSYIKKSDNKSINLTTNFDKIKYQINYLKNIIQPEQRSDEWYIFRSSTLTASNIYKIFVSEYSQSQLIIEKSEPIDVNKYKNNNLNSPMHWGQKYEPVSILYYEYINKTSVTEFGCIPHKNHSYLAASPDGIVCDEKSPLFGRMLEIKNVVSREITGIPKMEYWVQMQLQMEVCDLNECDFLETKFIEYLNEEEYEEDISSTNYRGFIMQFCENEQVHYEYPPFLLNNIHSKEYSDWTNMQLKKNNNKEYIRNIYWKLDIISCVLVLRNKLWFKNIQPYIEIFWNNLIEERESGLYKERLSKKRKMKFDDDKSKSDFPNSGCLINI